MNQHPSELSKLILAKRAHFHPKVAIVLGSGLSELADELQDPVTTPYYALPGFPVGRVEGHPGQLILGYFNGVPVVCCQGRVHAYEGMQGKDFKLFIRTLKALGCESILMTNATGSLRPDFQPGQMVLITDHINFQLMNPLVGFNDDEFGSRFFAMEEAYDKELRQILQTTAKKLGLGLHEGVYFGVLGPSFETPAEIRAFRRLGADVVGMSTIPEVLVARHCGMRVAVVSVVSNLASGMSDEVIVHKNVLHYVARACQDLNALLRDSIPLF